jgi:regulatory protein
LKKLVKQIEPVKKRYRIVTNDDAYLIEEDTLVHFRLVVGKELSSGDVQAIQAYDDQVRGLQQAYHYLSFKPRSVAQMKEYLRTKEVHNIEWIIEQLKDKGYLKDEATANWILEQTQMQTKGAAVAKQKMIQAKIHPSIIETVLATFSVDDRFDMALARARKLLKPSTKSLVATKASLLQKLVVAGFSYEMSQRVIETLQDDIRAVVDEPAAITRWLKAHSAWPKEKQIRTLLQQGFSYSVVQRLIDRG